MKALFAIIKLSIRTALSGRLPGWLLLSVMGCVTILPFFMHGDGSAEGRMRMAVAYPLSIAFALLAVGTLWLSAAAVSREIAGKQLQSVLVKPVNPLTIWLGKWFAVILINLVILCCMSIGLIFSLHLLERNLCDDSDAQHLIKERVLTARRSIVPEPIRGLRENAEYTRRRLIRERAIAPDTPLEKISNQLKIMHSAAAPGQMLRWNIRLDNASAAAVARGARISLRYRFQCSPFERRRVSGNWTIAGTNSSNTIHITAANLLDGTHVIELPLSFTPQKGLLQISFVSVIPSDSDADSVPTLYFDADAPVELLVAVDSFAVNLTRSMIAVFAYLAGIAALGLAMSSMFSFPVAVFASVATLFAFTLAGVFSEESTGCQHDAPVSAVVTFTEPLLLAFKKHVAGITGNLPIADLAGGMLYSGQSLANSVVILLFLVPLVSWIISGLILARKELAA